MIKKFIPPLPAAPLLAAVLILAAGCKDGKAASGDTLDKDTSYAVGMVTAENFHLPGVTLDYDAFVEGYKAYLRDDTRMSLSEAIDLILPVYMGILTGEEEKFFSENAQKPGIATTPSGLQYEVINQGEGKKPGPADMVRVHYRGTLTDGTVFDSSYDRGEPAVFPLNGVIPGWTEGLQLMNEGGSFRFYIPSAMAYGDQGAGAIPPRSPLIFDVELLSIESGQGE